MIVNDSLPKRFYSCFPNNNPNHEKEVVIFILQNETAIIKCFSFCISRIVECQKENLFQNIVEEM